MNNDGVNALKTIKVKVEPTSPDEIDEVARRAVDFVRRWDAADAARAAA